MPQKISFKNVGKTLEEIRVELNQTSGSLNPVGIKTPLRQGNISHGIFEMNFTLENQIHDNLKNLILTNHGERLGLFDFGANLRPLMSELNSKEDFDVEAVSKIRIAVSKWMSFVSLDTFESSIDRFNNKHVGKIMLKIVYGVPILGINDKELNIIFNVM
mgnify:FL=1